MKDRRLVNMEMPEPEKPPDPIEIAFFAAELSDDTPSVDLHDLNPKLAIDALGNFLHKEFINSPRLDYKVVKVIHGRGSGTLQKMVADYLVKSKKFVVKFRTSNDPKQMNGVMLVALAPNKK
jgi:dsDNA-specific endonuclease/ATPase MutS2